MAAKTVSGAFGDVKIMNWCELDENINEVTDCYSCTKKPQNIVAEEFSV